MMVKKTVAFQGTPGPGLSDIRQVIDAARGRVAVAVNAELTMLYGGDGASASMSWSKTMPNPVKNDGKQR
jgi:hypothetical protein